MKSMHQKYFSSEIHPNSVDIPDETVDEIMGTECCVNVFGGNVWNECVQNVQQTDFVCLCSLQQTVNRILCV